MMNTLFTRDECYKQNIANNLFVIQYITYTSSFQERIKFLKI